MAANVLPFGPRDSGVDRQEIVDTLKRMLDGASDLKGFPANFKLALREKVWENERVFAGGTRQSPVSFHNFIHEHYPVGLGATFELVETLIRGDNEAVALWTEITKRDVGRPEKVSGEILYNVQDKPAAPTGNSAEAGLRKLQKAAAEGNDVAQAELTETIEGRKSVHAACVDAGLRKNTRIDADVKQRCFRSVAEWIVSHGGQDDLSPVIADLFACGAKGIAVEIKNLVGESVMDRRYGS